MSRWNHAQCLECWVRERGWQEPVRDVRAPMATCCYCGHATMMGIYRRADPETMPCKGEGHE